MSTRRLLVPVVLAVGLLPFAAAPASGAPPVNDEPQGALVLQLGDRVVQDTSEATTTAQDEALNASCGAPATTASVWYTYSPDRDRTVVLDVTASDYSGGVLVFAGTPAVDSVVACGPGIVGLRARAGESYSIMVVSDTGVNGGRLVLSLENSPPPPRVHVSMAQRGVAFRAGAARLNGTYSCRHGEFAALSGTLFQRAGRLKIRAEFGRTIRCNGERRRWSARVVSPVGTYARGQAMARVRIVACGILTCRQARTERREIELVWAIGSHPRQLVQPPTTRTQRPRPLVGLQGGWPGS
jgi:hypothetical protein